MGRRDPEHLAWIRRQPCCVAFCNNGDVQAHHLRTAANSGTGLKPPDLEVVPLCGDHHRELHDVGRLTFANKYSINLEAWAIFLASVSGQDMP